MATRTITVPAPPPEFSNYTIEYLRVGLLTYPVDHGLVAYQRNQGHLNKKGNAVILPAAMKTRWKKYDEFDARFLRFREVSARDDGSFACMDGNGSNHWLESMYGSNFLVPCKVYEKLTPAEEAALFLGFQKCKPVSRTEEFIAGGLAGEEKYTQATEITEAYGYSIGTGRKPNVIGWSAVENVLKFGETRLQRTLEILRTHFSTNMPVTGSVEAIADIMGNEDLDPQILARVLSRNTINGLRENHSGGAARTTTFNNIMRQYNDEAAASAR